MPSSAATIISMLSASDEMHHPCRESIRITAVEADEHIAVLPVEAAHKYREIAALIAAQISDAQAAGEPVGGVVYKDGRLTHAARFCPGFCKEYLTCGGQRNRPRAAVKHAALSACTECGRLTSFAQE